MRRLNEHGVRSFWIYDVLYGVDNFARLARIAKEYGSEVVGTVFYTMSPVHTDEYLAAKAAEIAAVPEIDGVLFYDTAGVLDVERLRDAGAEDRRRGGAGKPVEIHANNLMGTSGLAYVEAVRHGVRVLHTASRSMANGPSMPSTESVVRNLELMGCTHGIDTSLLAPVDEHFRARRPGRRATSSTRSASTTCSTSPTRSRAGWSARCKAQLEQHGMADRIDEVLAETGEVRRELGWPVMATPLSQLVGTQAVLNVVDRGALRAGARRGRRLRGGPLRRAAGADRRRRCWTGSWPRRRPSASWPTRPSSRRSRSCAPATAPGGRRRPADPQGADPRVGHRGDAGGRAGAARLPAAPPEIAEVAR